MDQERDLAQARLALQQGLVDTQQLLKILDTHWQDGTSGSLVDRLVETGALPSEEREAFETLSTWGIGANRGPALAETRLADSQGSTTRLDFDVVSLADGNGSAATPGGRRGDGAERPADRYQILQAQARGGVGQVWQAYDRLLNRRVALKELRPDRGSAILLAKLLDEARITGRLEHPSIVPVYDLITAGDQGLPFFIMRLISGRTLAEAIRDHHRTRTKADTGADRAPWFELLNAFTAICNAVGYAHSQNVLHRDLKPQNVMLGSFGEVFVLDWGLAKQTVADPSDPEAGTTASDSFYPLPPGAGSRDSSLETAAGQVMGTPSYLPPEQARGEVDRIDARTDVFGLGAILFEMLTGRPPYLAGSRAEVLALVQQGPPPAPRSLDARVPRGLDAICRKALAFERDQRYPSAADLAADVRRWLADQRVSVGREPVVDRLSRWARRHRTLLIAALATSLALSGALAVGLVLVNQEKARVESARDAARIDYEHARDVVQTMLGQIADEGLAADPRFDRLRQNIIREALIQASAFSQRSPGAQEAANLTELTTRYGRLLMRRDDFARGLAQLATARMGARQALEQFPGDPKLRDRLAEACLTGADALLDAGRYRELMDWIDEGRQVAEAAVEAAPQDPAAGRTLGRIRLAQARACNDTGRSAAAQAAAREAIRLVEAFAGGDRNEGYLFLTPLAHWELGRAQRAEGDIDAARASLEAAVTRGDALRAAYPDLALGRTPHYRIRLQWTLLAASDERFRDDPGAIRTELEGIARALEQNAAMMAGPMLAWYQFDQGRVAHALGQLSLAEGQPAGAQAAFDQAVGTLEPLLQKTPWTLAVQRELALVLLDRATWSAQQGRDDQARSDRDRAVSLLRAVVAAEPETVAARDALANRQTQVPSAPTRP